MLAASRSRSTSPIGGSDLVISFMGFVPEWGFSGPISQSAGISTGVFVCHSGLAGLAWQLVQFLYDDLADVG